MKYCGKNFRNESVKYFRYGAWLLGAVFPFFSRADVDARAIALNCLTCHSEHSESVEITIPALNQLNEREMLQGLLDFKYDRKAATLMPRIAKGYSDAELAALARYLAGH